jgi:hypothetical protein
VLPVHVARSHVEQVDHLRRMRAERHDDLRHLMLRADLREGGGQSRQGTQHRRSS